MRKTLVQAILAAFCAIPCVISSLGGDGMMIGARTAAWSRAWANPYISNGLISMWDGEWNAGGGVHAQDTDFIEDLSGNGNRYHISSKANYAFYPNYIQVRELPEYGVNGAVLESVDYENFTAEVICDFNYGTGYPKLLYCSLDTTTSKFRDDASLYINREVPNGALTLKSGEDNFRPALGYKNGYHAYTINGAIQTLYQNGDKTSISAPLRGHRDNCLWEFGISNNKNAICRMYCLRIYNRALSDAEIARNYAIDKARFNLP